MFCFTIRDVFSLIEKLVSGIVAVPGERNRVPEFVIVSVARSGAVEWTPWLCLLLRH